jgi:hypothetical protein
MLTQPIPQTDAEYEAAFGQLLTEMSRLDEQIDRDRAESQRIKMETEIIKARTEGKLARLEELVNSLRRPS